MQILCIWIDYFNCAIYWSKDICGIIRYNHSIVMMNLKRLQNSATWKLTVIAFEIARASTMIDTTEKALSPVSFITFLFGFGIFRYPSDQLRYRFSIFYILTVWSVYAYTIYYIMTLFSIKSICNSFTAFFVIINFFSAIISTVIAI